MTALDQLLELQEHDTRIDQLRHRRGHLPEHTALAEVEAKRAALEGRLTEATARRDEVLARQSHLEAEVSSIESRIAEIDKRLYGGTVTASRDLQAMSSEVDSLKARRSALEDEELEAMEEAEPLVADVEAIEAERTGLADTAESLRAAIEAAQADIDAELATLEAERGGLAAGIPDDLHATYDRLRAKLDGVGAAKLVGGSCYGCHLTLPAQERARIKSAPPDELVFCDQCGRILVR